MGGADAAEGAPQAHVSAASTTPAAPEDRGSISCRDNGRAAEFLVGRCRDQARRLRRTKMAIDKSGTYWVGTEGVDIDEYLRELTAEGYPADRFVHAKCGCGHDRFRLHVDADEGCARRTCAQCRLPHFLCDSEDAWEAGDPKEVVCPCGAKFFEIAVAFSHRDDATVRWITIGQRCVDCGVLGAAVDWKIDYSPTEHLYGQV
jgi:hypothetical protein